MDIKIKNFAEFLLEAFFNGAVNLEESVLPPGFSQTDIQSMEDFVISSLKESTDEEPLIDPEDVDALTTSVDIDTLVKNKIEKNSGKADHETPFIHLKIVNEQGKEWDQNELKNIITTRPETLLLQNEKISKSGGKNYVFYNITLPAYRGLWFDENNNEFKMVTTCPSAGVCKEYCYARRGGYIQYPRAFIRSTRILNFLLNDWRGFKSKLTSEIIQAHEKSKNQNSVAVIRWHDSGDFFNEKYLEIALDIARETPEVIHYAYTKSVEITGKSDKPRNFVFNYSLGGLQDKLVTPDHKKSIVVPKKLFKDLYPQHGPHTQIKSPLSPENWNVLKERLFQEYNLPLQSIISYTQLQNIPHNHRDLNIIPKYNVVVTTADGDDAAMRKDVISTLLLIH